MLTHTQLRKDFSKVLDARGITVTRRRYSNPTVDDRGTHTNQTTTDVDYSADVQTVTSESEINRPFSEAKIGDFMLFFDDTADVVVGDLVQIGTVWFNATQVRSYTHPDTDGNSQVIYLAVLCKMGVQAK